MRKQATMTSKILLVAITITATLLLYSGLVAFTPKSTTQTTLPNFPQLQTADAAFDAFIKINGIEGEVAEFGHEGEILVESFSWGMSQTSAGHLGGGGAGKVNFNDFSIVKALDKASPKLALACASGQHITEVTLTLYRAGGETRQKYMEYKMTDVFITSVNQGGNANGDVDKPLENVSFSYGKVEWKYTQQRADGGPGGTTQTGWDLKKNQQI